MSDQERSSGDPFVERRSESAGIRSGGRRKSDRVLIDGSKKSTIWIALSFAFSACVIGWAFSLPFRGEKAPISFSSPDSDTEDVTARPIRADGQQAKDEYVQQMLYLEEDLRAQIEQKRRMPRNVPDKHDSRKQWKKGLDRRLIDARLLTELADGEAEEGTLQWHAQQDLKAYLADQPQ